ncbi:hypothetical protein [Xanthomonas sacchari]|uniref:hypothetical protein n=1 Tax=Xanthomonas sacchari TaxID=56458 RepID=UPI0011107776|nr:hypothetical protein [Xanthomonas sacchari]MDV0439042.1 hypothetical protein [Xanthomonas sacchari]
MGEGRPRDAGVLGIVGPRETRSVLRLLSASASSATASIGSKTTLRKIRNSFSGTIPVALSPAMKASCRRWKSGR